MSEALPQLLDDIAELVGEGAALRIAHQFGGTQIYLPRPEHIGPEHALARAIGLASARAIAESLGPGHIDVPLGPTANAVRSRRIAIDHIKSGHSLTAAARAAGMTVRGVRKLRARLERRGQLPNPQRDLFEPRSR